MRLCQIKIIEEEIQISSTIQDDLKFLLFPMLLLVSTCYIVVYLCYEIPKGALHKAYLRS
jgi:hypothetical protein